MEIVKHLHQRPGRMARTGALQSVEDTGPTFPAVKPEAVHHRSLRERGDDFLMRRYCIDLGPRECASALHLSWPTLIKRAKELDIDHRRESWKNNTLSLGGWRKQAAERLGVIEKKTTVVQPYRPDFMSSGPSWAGFESRRSSRPGAEDYREHPSRYSDARVFMDGRREKVA